MDKIFTILGGIALGVIGYKIGEAVQERRTETGDENYNILDYMSEKLDDTLEDVSETLDSVTEKVDELFAKTDLNTATETSQESNKG